LTTPESVPVREAATVAVVRDGRDGLEVFMVRRTVAAVFSPGAHVFPGGAVDQEDRLVELELRCDGLNDATASVVLGVPAGGLGYFVAAARECFEEAGLLLARHDGELVADADRYRPHRDALNAGARSMLDVCIAESLTLAVDLLMPFGHWITPVGPPRRFDTRFFVAPAPPGQDPSHDGWETTEGLWMRPVDVLAAADRGHVDLIEPTRHTLSALTDYQLVDDVFATEVAEVAEVAEGPP
jgi:8-oxo-dGTP pyrophosphatase MutT (NUDIX family)